MDLDSSWSRSDGKQALIPRILLFSVLGYRYSLPDMIGGNGYGKDGLLGKNLPSAELYIRWTQMHLLLPMQFSIAPWCYDGDPLAKEVYEVVYAVFALRKKLLSFLREAVEVAKFKGIPLARPMWFAAPTHLDALEADDQYMIGDKIVIAPVLTEATTFRSVFLPQGNWKECADDSFFQFLLIDEFSPNPLKLFKSHSTFIGPCTLRVSNISLTSMPPCFIHDP